MSIGSSMNDEIKSAVKAFLHNWLGHASIVAVSSTRKHVLQKR